MCLILNLFKSVSHILLMEWWQAAYESASPLSTNCYELIFKLIWGHTNRFQLDSGVYKMLPKTSVKMFIEGCSLSFLMHGCTVIRGFMAFC